MVTFPVKEKIPTRHLEHLGTGSEGRKQKLSCAVVASTVLRPFLTAHPTKMSNDLLEPGNSANGVFLYTRASPPQFPSSPKSVNRSESSLRALCQGMRVFQPLLPTQIG